MSGIQLHPGDNVRFDAERRPAEGHEHPLAQMINKSALVRLVFTDGSQAVGQIRGFDPYTINLHLDGDPWPTTFFKHDIRSFTGVE